MKPKSIMELFWVFFHNKEANIGCDNVCGDKNICVYCIVKLPNAEIFDDPQGTKIGKK